MVRQHKIMHILAAVLVVMSCRAAVAIQVSEYFRIAEEFQKNPQATVLEWTGKEICLEEEISSVGVNSKGGAFIGFTRHSDETSKDLKTIDSVGYGFHFDGQPEAVKALQKGQRVRVRGKIINIYMNDDARVQLLMIHAEPSRILRVYPYTPPEDGGEADWFFGIAYMYETDPDTAKRIWLGKEVTIESEIGSVMTVDDELNPAEEGNMLVMFVQRTQALAVQGTAYLFLFDGTPEYASELTAGRTVRLRGKVESISEQNGIYYFIIVSSSQLVR